MERERRKEKRLVSKDCFTAKNFFTRARMHAQNYLPTYTKSFPLSHLQILCLSVWYTFSYVWVLLRRSSNQF